MIDREKLRELAARATKYALPRAIVPRVALTVDKLLALLDELDAAEARIAELQDEIDAYEKCVVEQAETARRTLARIKKLRDIIEQLSDESIEPAVANLCDCWKRAQRALAAYDEAATPRGAVKPNLSSV